jgi:drug/metabolite transporter (DMT)-like permease
MQRTIETRLSFSFGAALALLSAVLFGASTPLAKVLLGSVEPWLLAAVLYLGSGIGLLVVRSVLGARRPREVREVSVAGRGWLWLGGANLFGGVIAPVLLMVGLAHTPAASASLLLNLEGVLTVVLAWFAFRENFDRRIALGMLAITMGAGLLSWQGGLSLKGIAGPIAIAGACLGWAVDNNLTRKVFPRRSRADRDVEGSGCRQYQPSARPIAGRAYSLSSNSCDGRYCRLDRLWRPVR